MNAVIKKRFVFAGMALGIVFGCVPVVTHVVEEASQGDGGTSNFATVDSEFSDLPAAPEGTPSPVGPGIEPDEIVTNEEGPVGELTRSFFTAYQLDPEAEDTAGPKFVVSGDVNQDGLLDLVSGWNQSQPVQLHLQQRDAEGNISFRTVTLAGTTPVAVIAGVEFGQINDDNGDGLIDDNDWLDVVVLSKATGFVTLCPPKQEGGDPGEIGSLDGEILVYFSPGNAGLIADGDAWMEVVLINPFVADPWIHDQFPGREDEGFDDMKAKPERGGFTALAVANIDGQPGDDILVALNPGECETLGQKPPTNTVDLWTNPGVGLAATSALWGAPPPPPPPGADPWSRNVPITLLGDAPAVNDLVVTDIDGDGDLDVVATYTNSISANVRWARNPLVAHTLGGPEGLSAVTAGTTDGWRYWATEWQERPIGQVDTAADALALGDLDNDGFDDLVVRSSSGQLVQWFRRPNALTIAPEFPPNDPVPDRFNFPWPVFTLTEFNQQEPEAVALGDITGDGKLEMAIAAEGAVLWYDGTIGETVYDPWVSNTIIQDSPPDTTDATQAGPAPVAGAGVGVTEVDTSTNINSLLIVDLDGDGRQDIIGTLDRRSGAGLSDDRLVWYRNTRTEPEEE